MTPADLRDRAKQLRTDASRLIREAGVIEAREWRASRDAGDPVEIGTLVDFEKAQELWRLGYGLAAWYASAAEQDRGDPKSWRVTNPPPADFGPAKTPEAVLRLYRLNGVLPILTDAIAHHHLDARIVWISVESIGHLRITLEIGGTERVVDVLGEVYLGSTIPSVWSEPIAQSIRELAATIQEEPKP